MNGNRVRIAKVFTSTSSVLAVATMMVACSGSSDDAGLTQADASGGGEDASLIPDSGSSAADTSSSPKDASASNDVSNNPADVRTEDVTPLDIDGGDAGIIPCIVGGKAEVEPNDNKDSAMTLSGTICGLIAPPSESDFYTFRIKQDTQTMSIVFHGDVSVKVTVENQSVTLTPGNYPPVPFVRNKDYILEVKSIDSNRHAYRLKLEESS